MTDTEPARRHREGLFQLNAQLTPADPYEPIDLHHFQQLQLQAHASSHQQGYNSSGFQQHAQQLEPHALAFLSSSQNTTSLPQHQQQHNQNAQYADWQAPHLQARNFGHATVSGVSENTIPAFGDWSQWDAAEAHSLDASAYRSSSRSLSHHLQDQKRASSSSSHASFGPHTPRHNSQVIPRVEVYDSDGHIDPNLYPWPEDLDFQVSDDTLKQFNQVFGGSTGSWDIYPQGNYAQQSHERDVQRLKDPRIRQLMMSQESTGSRRRMGPPALPRTESTETDGGYKLPTDPSMPKLDRTMSDIYQDALYNPSLQQAPTSPSRPVRMDQGDSPKRGIMRELLASANNDHLKARSQSPVGPILRDRSPFKPNAPESPQQDSFPASSGPPSQVNTAAKLRELNKLERDKIVAAKHQPGQTRPQTVEALKTISPKEVALTYEEDEAASKLGPLFPEEPPVKRRKQEHGTVPNLKPPMTRESTRGSNASDISQPSFGSMATSRRESSQSNGTRQQVQYPFFAQAQRQASSASNATGVTESTAEYPAQLTSTESTKSDVEVPSRKRPLLASSPKLRTYGSESTDIDGDELTYTCTYHGCTKRFDSQAALQKHKRDIHHSTAHHSRNTSITGASASPVAPSARSTPGSTNTATAAQASDSAQSATHTASAEQIAERNSQAGPHICNRINPSTGRPCNSHFSRPYDLTRHEDTIHNNRKQKVRCMYCKDEKSFSRNDALTRHMRVVHPDVQFPGKERRGGRGG